MLRGIFLTIKGGEHLVELKRLDNESNEELIYRIASAKNEIGSWQDVADILNQITGDEYTESKYRKQYNTFIKMLNANSSIISNNEEYLKKLQETEENLRKERIKLQTLNIERNRLDRSESRQTLYYEQIKNAITTLPLPEFQPLQPLGYCTSEKYVTEYVCCISDLHYGANFISENNVYSPEIAEERMCLLLHDLRDFIHNHKVRKLHVVCLGDTLQGLLRVSDLKINDASVVKSTVQVSRLIANFLNTLSTYTDVDYYHVPTANHTQTRPLGTKASELSDEDLEYVIGNYIKDLCARNNRINVHLDEENKNYLVLDIAGFEIIAAHGHQFKNLDTALRDLSMVRRSFCDYLIVGHYHNGKELPVSEGCVHDTEILVCPSFVGSDPYSDTLLKGSKASVKIFGFNEIYGHNETYKFILN